jgi:small subunit ribosomal protein S5
VQRPVGLAWGGSVPQDRTGDDLFEKLVKLNRVAKVVKGGRRFSFSALIVVGDRNGRAGFGLGKANYVADAIGKGIEKAKSNMRNVPVRKSTLPHELLGRYKAAEVLLKPASPGTGIIAGGPVRSVMEALGIRDVLAKSMGASNQMNIVKAVFTALEQIVDPKLIAANRGKSLAEMWG